MRRRLPPPPPLAAAAAAVAVAAVAALAAAAAAACTSAPSSSPAPTPLGTPAPAAAAPALPGTVKDATFHSAALGVDKRYVIYLPGGYDARPERRWPVVYMLHGLGGNEDNWTKHGELAAVADALGLHAIVVMPDGDDSFYANRVAPTPDYDACLRGKRTFGRERDMATWCVRTANYEDYLVRDLVAHVDATYRTVPERRARAIGGLSMGGFGALMLAMRHRDVYASAASHSGVVALLYGGPHPYEKGKVVLADDASVWGHAVEPIGAHVRAIFGPDIANWRAHDPAHLARTLHDGELALYLDCGAEDEFLLHDGMQYLHDVLVERGVSHAYHLGPGRHDFAFWTDRLDDSLSFHVEQFRKAGL